MREAGRSEQQPFDAASAQCRASRRAAGAAPATAAAVTLDDFFAYMPQHSYIYVPSREPWPGASVNAGIPPIPLAKRNGQAVLNKAGEPVTQPASIWLDKN